MEEELAIRIIPEERSVMLLQVSKRMRDLPSTAFMVFGGCGGVHACPYCSSPSVLSACCHLRRSEPLQWAEADALEMLR